MGTSRHLHYSVSRTHLLRRQLLGRQFLALTNIRRGYFQTLNNGTSSKALPSATNGWIVFIRGRGGFRPCPPPTNTAKKLKNAIAWRMRPRPRQIAWRVSILRAVSSTQRHAKRK